ncbi:cytochrome oxidase assembly protein [Flavobacterium akiainvivens]|uniref:Cytochrome oxidase assembly protein n=1 Tax=Flavobacterium akiainvivens TaxID=1202724 RepID=A0A0M8MC61_9FLAO|nr:COX15/CtaA family protein [Flavobacterium akiainvivens]KOS08123.1 cytochrome oxidase assembly protein [Flavobacterium akiainvivens]SFQ72097.1 cytochrome c oxidase assembly protein subunit 15 [Flavobacterium akiainvivens]
MKRFFPRITKIALILVYLVIVAGAVVRMSGSGMGCPDWPRCFGYYIPPTDSKELQFTPNHAYNKGQVIILNEKLWVAKQNFTSGIEYNAANWEVYTKHDYAEFNPVHTWVEYINRLTGALAGLAVFIMAVASFSFWKEKGSIILLSWLTVFLMGFQAWLGATVVYSVLNPVKITVHMVVALLIVVIILVILNKAKGLVQTYKTVKYDAFFNRLLWVSLLFTLVQVVLGTQVRQFVDHSVKAQMAASDCNCVDMSTVMAEPDLTFYIHRSFSIVLLALNIWVFIMNKQKGLGFKKTSWVLSLLLLITASGIAMYNFDFPFASQSVHLVVASIVFGLQFYMIMESSRSKRSAI